MKTYSGLLSRKHFVAIVITALVLLAGTVISAEPQRRLFGRKAMVEDPVTEIKTRINGTQTILEISFTKGKEHNHPLMAVWLEDLDSNYIQTIYVAQSIAEGVFRHGDASTGRWMPGPIRRPAALPYWGHQRGIKAPDGYYLPTREDPMPDAITGPTPKGSFLLHTGAPEETPRQFRVMFEINQSWNWNEYWTNNKFPGDEHYMTSSQPAIVYEAVIDLDRPKEEYTMEPIGHSHWSGQTGELFTDLSTITTALEIAETIKVVLKENQ